VLRRDKFKRDNGWQPVTDAGSRGRKAVAYERVVIASDLVIWIRVICLWLYTVLLFFVPRNKLLVNKQKEITKYMCDSVNHTRFPEEDHLPDWVCRD